MLFYFSCTHSCEAYLFCPSLSVVAQVLHPQGAVWRLREESWNSNLFGGTVSSVSESKRKYDSIALETEMLQFKVAVLRSISHYFFWLHFKQPYHVGVPKIVEVTYDI